MKSLLRIVVRYFLTAIFISFSIVLLSIGVYIWSVASYRTKGYYAVLSQITDGFYIDDETKSLYLKPECLDLIKEQYLFAMELDQNGNIIWQYNLPNELKRQYSLSDMASMTRWYLEDYPVKVWVHDYGIFVAGLPKNSVAKYRLELSPKALSSLLVWLPLCNLGFILVLCMILAFKLYHALLPIGKGLDSLADNRPICLRETGITCELAKKLNQTSQILTLQHEALEKRDMARTNWITGVSHDIRTPLSMVMGYAESLEGCQELSLELQHKAAIIKEQSLVIRDLIEDLNLTSKLEYQMHPLRIGCCRPAAMIRQLAAAYYNQNLPDSYEILLEISHKGDEAAVSGDKRLLNRAFQNIIGNSIRHNPEGCAIWISVDGNDSFCLITFSDNGIGLPDYICCYLSSDDESFLSEGTHILGLRLVKQIVTAHDGTFTVIDNHTIQICLPAG